MAATTVETIRNMARKQLRELTARFWTDAELDEKRVTIEDDGENQDETRRLTYREHLQELVDGKEDFPTFFASTEY